MKKLLITAMALVINGSIFFSCKKNSNPSSTPVQITGYWFGTYTSATGDGNAGIVFNTNSTSVVYIFGNTSITDTANCPFKAYGTFSVDGNVVKVAATTPNQVTLNYKGSANVSANPNSMSGTYTNSNGENGTFIVTKK